MARPDILLVIDSFELGGTETFATRAVEALRVEGLCVHVACLRAQGPLLERVRNAASGFHLIEAPSGPLRIAGLVTSLRRLIDRLSPNCVYTQDVYSNYLSAIALLGRPSIRFVTSRRWARTPSRARRLLANWAARRADAVVVNSERLAESVANEGVHESRIHLVPNIVDDAMFTDPGDEARVRWRNELSIPREATVLMVAGRLHSDKGPDLAIEAIAQMLRDGDRVPHLVLMGDGPMLESLRAQVRALSLEDRVSFGGSYRTPPNVFAYCDVALLPSRTEGMPNALLEAAAAGRVCVAAEVGGVQSAAEFLGESVVTFPAANVVAMAAAIGLVTETTKPFAAAASVAAAKVRERHSPQAVAGVLYRLLVPAH